VITQCSIRHLYASKLEPGMSAIIDKAKLFERRRCDHRPEEYPEPLSATECISSVVDPKSSKTNKHRYVVASQQLSVRRAMREVMGVPFKISIAVL
jgi:U3 small nucleolar RNA-associated protein 23